MLSNWLPLPCNPVQQWQKCWRINRRLLLPRNDKIIPRAGHDITIKNPNTHKYTKYKPVYYSLIHLMTLTEDLPKKWNVSSKGTVFLNYKLRFIHYNYIFSFSWGSTLGWYNTITFVIDLDQSINWAAEPYWCFLCEDWSSIKDKSFH